MTKQNADPDYRNKRGCVPEHQYGDIVELCLSRLTYRLIGRRFHISAKHVGDIARAAGVRRNKEAVAK